MTCFGIFSTDKFKAVNPNVKLNAWRNVLSALCYENRFKRTLAQKRALKRALLKVNFVPNIWL